MPEIPSLWDIVVTCVHCSCPDGRVQQEGEADFIHTAHVMHKGKSTMLYMKIKQKRRKGKAITTVLFSNLVALCIVKEGSET